MGVLESFGALAGSIIAAIVMLLFAIVGFYIVLFVVGTGSAIAGYEPSADFAVLSAAILTAGAIVAGTSPITAIAESE